MTVAEPAQPAAVVTPDLGSLATGPDGPAETTAPGTAGFGSRLGTSLAASLIMTALVAVAGVLTSRLLGPAGRGRVSTAVVVAVAVASLATVGVELWATGQVARHGWPGAAAPAIRRQALAVLIGCGLVAAGAAIALAGTDQTLVLATTAVAAATAMMALTLAVPLGLALPRAQAGSYLAYGGVTLVLAGAIFAADRPSVALAVGAIAGGRAAGAAANVVLTRAGRRAAAGPTPREDRPHWGAIYRFGLPASVGTTLTQSIYRLDFLLLAALGNARLVGLYAVASTATEVLWLIPDALGVVLLPHVAATRSFGDTARLVRFSGLALLVGGGLVALTSPVLIPLIFGQDFADATQALVPLAIAGVFLGTWKLLVADLAGRGDGRTRAVSVGVGVAVMAAADLVLIPPFGIAGAGIGSALGYGATALLAARAWRGFGGHPAQLVRPEREDLVVARSALRRLRRAGV